MFDKALAAAQLVALYRRAYVMILERIGSISLRGGETAFERGLVRDVGRILDELDGATRLWAEQVIPRTYSEAQAAAVKPWLDAGLAAPTIAVSFTKVHEHAVEVVAVNFLESMQDATQFVGRMMRDEWRRASLEAVAQQLTTGETVRQATVNLQNTLALEGLTGFKDRAGNLWRLDDYAEMVIRTTTAECTNLGTTNQLRELGHDLVQLTEHRGACPLCVPYEGRVYSVSGDTSGYPPLSDVPGFREGYQTMHPNCRHRVSPYVAALDRNRSETQERSNRPYEDTRSEAEREAYDREQKQNALRRERQRLEEQYSVMPDGPERDAVREKLRRVRGKQQQLGREREAWLRSLGV